MIGDLLPPVPLQPIETARAIFNPYISAINYIDFEKKYNIVSPDNLGMDKISFGESLKNYEESVLSEFKGTTKHSAKHETVREGLLQEFIESIMKSSWLKQDLKKTVRAEDGHHFVPAVVLQLGDEVTMQKMRMASALLFEFLSSKTPRKKTIFPTFNLPPLRHIVVQYWGCARTFSTGVFSSTRTSTLREA